MTEKFEEPTEFIHYPLIVKIRAWDEGNYQDRRKQKREGRWEMAPSQELVELYIFSSLLWVPQCLFFIKTSTWKLLFLIKFQQQANKKIQSNAFLLHYFSAYNISRRGVTKLPAGYSTWPLASSRFCNMEIKNSPSRLSLRVSACFPPCQYDVGVNEINGGIIRGPGTFYLLSKYKLFTSYK